MFSLGQGPITYFNKKSGTFDMFCKRSIYSFLLTIKQYSNYGNLIGICKAKAGSKPNENGISPQKECVVTSPTDISSCVNSFDEPLNLSQTDSVGKLL